MKRQFITIIIFGVLTLQGCSRETVVLYSNNNTSDNAIQTEAADTVSDTRENIGNAITQKNQTTLIAVGDIMLSRHVGTKIVESGDNAMPFSHLHGLLASSDITFGNLESPFSDQGPRVTEGMTFKAEPEFIEGLVMSGFDVLSIANNHSLNQGVVGVTYTIDWLSQHDMLPVGGGVNFADAHTGAIYDANDTVGFLAYSYYGYNDVLGAQNPVIAEMNVEQMQQDVTNMQDHADIVIVSMHAGVEYVNEPNDQQIEFAHAAIDAGADLVIGHHPHWPQIYEQYEDGFIFYSLGNFVFDQEWSLQTKEGLMLSAIFEEGEVVRLELIALLIENYSTPRLTIEDEKARILSRIGLRPEGAVVYEKK